MTITDLKQEDQRLHLVQVDELSKYKSGLLDVVTAVCGVVYSPSLPIDLDKPRCATCFPTPQYVVHTSANSGVHHYIYNATNFTDWYRQNGCHVKFRS